jgi:hypothetical protein
VEDWPDTSVMTRHLKAERVILLARDASQRSRGL